MRVLLDTHTLLWWLAGSALLSRRAKGAITGASALLVSPLSFWEVARLAIRRRIELETDPHAWATGVLGMDEIVEAPLTPPIAVSAALLDPETFPGDPVDRVIYATAVDLDVPLVTRDRAIRDHARRAHDVRVIW